MNFNRTRSWPHPVVSPLSDDVSPNNFDFRLDVWPEHQRWLLGVEVADEDTHLAAYVRAGKASYVLHVECKRTYFRESFRSNNSRFEMPIPGERLFGIVEVSLLLVATADLDDYQHPGQHKDYRNGTFSVGIGQPIAVAQTKTFEAFLEADPILKLSSIINIRKGEADQKTMKVNCESDRVRVDLPPDQFDRYRSLRADPAIRGLLASTVILPALMDAFYYLRNPDLDVDEFKANHRWSRCVLGRLERLGLDVANANSDNGICLEAAQLLLREPLRRSLEDLNGLFSDPRS